MSCSRLYADCVHSDGTGLAVHMKIYPIIYCLTLYLPLASGSGWRSLLEVSTPRLRLVTATLLSLGILTLTFYHLYGHDFLEHTYLYHITRQDTSKSALGCDSSPIL